MLNRRGFLTGLIAAPAVIRVAPLMRVAPLVGWEEIVEEVALARGAGTSLLTIQQITREAIRLFRNSNSFLRAIDQQMTLQFEHNPLNHTLWVVSHDTEPWPT